MGKRPTKQERRDRLEMACKLLSQRLTNGEAKRVMSRHYNMSPRSVERYLRRARMLLLHATQKSASEHRADAYSFYNSSVGNPKLPLRERIRSQEQIVKLFALEGPIEVAQTNAEGSDTPTSEARDEFNRLLVTLLDRSQAAAPTGNETNGQATGPTPIE